MEDKSFVKHVLFILPTIYFPASERLKDQFKELHFKDYQRLVSLGKIKDFILFSRQISKITSLRNVDLITY